VFSLAIDQVQWSFNLVLLVLLFLFIYLAIAVVMTRVASFCQRHVIGYFTCGFVFLISLLPLSLPWLQVADPEN